MFRVNNETFLTFTRAKKRFNELKEHGNTTLDGFNVAEWQWWCIAAFYNEFAMPSYDYSHYEGEL